MGTPLISTTFVLGMWKCSLIGAGFCYIKQRLLHDARQSFVVCACYDCVMPDVVHHVRCIAGEATFLDPLHQSRSRGEAWSGIARIPVQRLY